MQAARILRFPSNVVPWSAPTVALTMREVSYCARIANERDTRNRRAGVVDRKNSRRSGEAIALDGVLGEYAFARMMNRPTDHLNDTTPRCARTDRDQDLLLDDGKTVDVKTTWFPFADLHVAPHKAVNPADFYALIIRDCDIDKDAKAEDVATSFSFRGYATAADVITPDTLRRIKTRQNNFFHVLSQNALTHALPDC